MQLYGLIRGNMGSFISHLFYLELERGSAHHCPFENQDEGNFISTYVCYYWEQWEKEVTNHVQVLKSSIHILLNTNQLPTFDLKEGLDSPVLPSIYNAASRICEQHQWLAKCT